MKQKEKKAFVKEKNTVLSTFMDLQNKEQDGNAATKNLFSIQKEWFVYFLNWAKKKSN